VVHCGRVFVGFLASYGHKTEVQNMSQALAGTFVTYLAVAALLIVASIYCAQTRRGGMDAENGRGLIA